MKISMEEFELIKEWSGLFLDNDEGKSLHKELEKILDSLSAIEEIKTGEDDTKPYTSQSLDDLREDRVTPSMDKDLALRNAPEVEDDMFRVPIILD